MAPLKSKWVYTYSANAKIQSDTPKATLRVARECKGTTINSKAVSIGKKIIIERIPMLIIYPNVKIK
jgi:hypothetical protein